MEFYRKNRRRCYFSKYYFIIFFLFGKISLVTNMKKKLIIIAIICVILDQLSKLLVISNLSVGSGFSVIPSFFSILYIRNTGAAWGMFSNGTLLLAIGSIVFLIFAIKYLYNLKYISKLSTFSYGMLIGGIIGNLIDRVFRNYVVDFLSFNIFGYSFPVFNIADCFIVISIILIVVESLMKEGKK